MCTPHQSRTRTLYHFSSFIQICTKPEAFLAHQPKIPDISTQWVSKLCRLHFADEYARRTVGVLSATHVPEATRWLSWYGVGLASADRLPVVVRIPAGPLGSLKCDPPKGNGRRPQKIGNTRPRHRKQRSRRSRKSSQSLRQE